MPFKHRYFYNRRRKTPKMQLKRNWSDYNKKMKMRGDISIWLSQDVIDQWYEKERVMMGQARQYYLVTWLYLQYMNYVKYLSYHSGNAKVLLMCVIHIDPFNFLIAKSI